MDYSTRYLIDRNESQFCSLWTHTTKVQNCADLFINESFIGDYFFNKTNAISPCPDIKGVIEESIKIFSTKGLKCYFYVHDNKFNRKLETTLIEKGFIQIDTMLVFVNNLENAYGEANDVIDIMKIDTGMLSLWTDIFCESFDVNSWRYEVANIVKFNFKQLHLVISIIKANDVKIPAGCAAMFTTDNVMGLYCLGTLPHLRRKGIARKILKAAIRTAKNQNRKILFAQTFVNEGFAEIYRKVGFDLFYQKKVYALNDKVSS